MMSLQPILQPRHELHPAPPDECCRECCTECCVECCGDCECCYRCTNASPLRVVHMTSYLCMVFEWLACLSFLVSYVQYTYEKEEQVDKWSRSTWSYQGSQVAYLTFSILSILWNLTAYPMFFRPRIPSFAYVFSWSMVEMVQLFLSTLMTFGFVSVPIWGLVWLYLSIPFSIAKVIRLFTVSIHFVRMEPEPQPRLDHLVIQIHDTHSTTTSSPPPPWNPFDQTQCTICMDPFLPSNPSSSRSVMLHPCRHMYHLSCITTWIRRSSSSTSSRQCCMCRSPIEHVWSKS